MEHIGETLGNLSRGADTQGQKITKLKPVEFTCLREVKRQVKGNNTRMTAKRLQNKPQQVVGPLEGMAIGQDWRVGADTLNIILYQRQVNKKTGKEYWRAHSYYATTANALVGLVNQGVRDTKLADLKTVSDKIEQLHKDIFHILSASH